MAALLAGQTLEGTPYEVVREIGAGGMGVVYEVRHVRLKKLYVAKVIHEHVRGEEGVQQRMEREADVLGKINHPNIVQVHDVGVMPDGTSYFVMEKLDGMDLRAAMDRRTLGHARALAIVVDVLDALDHVHRRGIVHRDIKPENVFLARQPSGVATKVLDFGIVHLLDGDGRGSQQRITKTGGFVGTLYYAAPEQMAGQPPAPPSDVYAAGLVLYELIAGRGPFDDDAGVGLARCFKPAPRLEGVAAALADAVASALEQAPERRPSAGALAQRLRQIAATTTSGTASARDEVEDLLSEVGVRAPPAAVESGGAAMTEAPRTPLMGGSPRPAPVSSGAPFAPAISVAPESPRAPPSAPVSSGSFERSAAKSTLPMMAGRSDTSPGVYNTVNSGATTVPPRASPLGTAAAIGAFVLVLGVLVVGAVKVLRPAAPAPAPSAAPALAPAESATPESPPAESAPANPPAADATEQAPATAPPSAPPAPSAPPPAARSAAAPSPAPKAPAPAKAGQAKKEGYQDQL